MNIMTTNDCPICLENQNINDSVPTDCCKNNIHGKCISEMINNKIFKCPLCRNVFTHDFIKMFATSEIYQFLLFYGADYKSSQQNLDDIIVIFTVLYYYYYYYKFLVYKLPYTFHYTDPNLCSINQP